MLGPEIAADVVAQCQMAAGEIGQTFTRALGETVEVAVGDSESLSLALMRSELAGPGLAVVLHVGGPALAILVPEAGGLLPEWVASADAAAQGKLTTLAHELGLLVLSEAFTPDDYQSVRVRQLAAALQAGGAADGAVVVRLALKSASKQAEAFVVWPLPTPRRIADLASVGDSAATDDGEGASGDEVSASRSEGHSNEESLTDASERPNDAGHHASGHGERSVSAGSTTQTERRRSLRDLPLYTRSLLKIRVPLSVTLAEKKQPVGQILEIGPGSILQFEKSCEDMLDLNVCNLPVARGEAVKVGDKFGLRVTSLILPGERFKPVQPVGSRLKQNDA